MEKEIDNFIKDYVSSSTQATYAYILNSFSNKLKKPLEQITSKDVEQYFNQFIKKHGIVSNTSRAHQTVLKVFFTKNGRKDLVEALKEIKIRVPERKPLSTDAYVSDEEYQKLLDVAEYVRDEIIIKILWSTGVRLSELIGIEVKDINFKEGLILVHGKGKGCRGEKDRYIPTTKAILDLISEYIKKNNLKSNNYLVGVQKNAIQKMLIILCKKAKIRNLHPHQFRHTFITRAVESGAYDNPLELSAITGHEDLETLRKVYYHARPSAIKARYKEAFGK